MTLEGAISRTTELASNFRSLEAKVTTEREKTILSTNAMEHEYITDCLKELQQYRSTIDECITLAESVNCDDESVKKIINLLEELKAKSNESEA